MTKVDAFLTGCRLADGRLVDIGLTDGKITTIGEGAASSSNGDERPRHRRRGDPADALSPPQTG